jgi:peptidoglycan-associated lipoprotein
MTVFDPSSTTNKYQPTAHSRIDFNLLIHFGFIFLFAVALQIIWTGKSLAEDSSKFSAFPLEKPFPSEASELSKFSEFKINDRRAGYNLDKNKPHGWKGSPQVNLKKLKQIGSIRAYSEYESIVIDNIENREGSTVGDYIYVSFRDVKLEVGDLFTVLSKKRLIRHPVYMSGEREKIPFIERRPAEAHNDLDTPLGVIMGNIVEVIGLIQIVEVGEKHSKAIVKESYWEVKPGDVLAPYHDPEYPDTRNETQSFPTKEGYLLAFKNEKDAAGYGDIAYIDMGKNDNVVPGDFFEIFTTPTHTIKAKWPQFRDRKIPMMRHLVGELQVVKVESETATVIVVKSFNQLRPGNEIKYKPREVPVLLAKMKKLHGAPNYGISDSEKARLLAEENLRNNRSADANRGFPEAEILDEDNSPFGWAGQEDDGKGSKMLTFRPTKHLTDIHFTFDQYDLDDASKKILRNNADYLKENPEVKVQIQGHTDDRGTNNYNLALGARRTSSIKNYLVSLGVEEDRMYVISFGEEQPFCLEAVEACRYQNRRAHFMIAIEEKDQF